MKSPGIDCGGTRGYGAKRWKCCRMRGMSSNERWIAWQCGRRCKTRDAWQRCLPRWTGMNTSKEVVKTIFIIPEMQCISLETSFNF